MYMKHNSHIADIMGTRSAIIPESYTVAEAIADLRTKSEEWDSLQYLYIVDHEGVLVAVMSLHQLFREPDDRLVLDFAERDLVVVYPDTDPEQAALKALHRGIREIPVVDTAGKIVGVLTGDSLMAILDQESVENILKFGGILSPISLDRYQSLKVSLTARLPWLLIGLIGGFGTAFIGQFFEAVLEQTILLALFIPLMVYMADATGAQMQAFMIRDLATQKDFQFWSYLGMQGLVILSLAITLSILLWGGSLVLYGQPMISLVLGLALFVAILSSIFSGIIVPYVFFQLKQDPANASGPIGTIIQDTGTIVIYFLIAQAIL